MLQNSWELLRPTECALCDELRNWAIGFDFGVFGLGIQIQTKQHLQRRERRSSCRNSRISVHHMGKRFAPSQMKKTRKPRPAKRGVYSRFSGRHEDCDQVENDVHVADAGRIATSRPATQIAQARRHSGEWGSTGAVDHGTWEEPWSAQTERARIHRFRWPGRVRRTHVAIITPSHAFLPGISDHKSYTHRISSILSFVTTLRFHIHQLLSLLIALKWPFIIR